MTRPRVSGLTGRFPWPVAGRQRPVAALWLAWLILAGAVYANPVRSAITLLFDPAAGDTVFDQRGSVVTGAAADAARATLAYQAAWLEFGCAAAAVLLATWSQLSRAELGICRTVRSRYVLGRGWGATAGYVFILGAAAAVTGQVLTVLHLAGRTYPGAGDAAHSAALTGAFLAGSVAAGVGEEILLFAIPIALAHRAGWPAWAVVVFVTVLRWSIHAYYGWTSLFVVVWIPVAYLLYRAAGSIWPLVAGHGLFDLLQFGQNAWPAQAEAISWVSLTVAVTGAVLLYVGNGRYWRDRPRRAPAGRAPA